MNRSRRRPAPFLYASLAVAAHVVAAPLPAARAQTAPPTAVTANGTRADALSIGPGLFTFPQIAAFLSTPEQPITCDFALKDRAAFVFLQNRSRSELKDLLSAGLQVEFVHPDAPAGVVVTRANEPNGNTQRAAPLTMVRQKAVAEREAYWLKRAAQMLQVEMDRKITEVLSYGNKPYADMEKAYKIAVKADALEKEVGAPPYKSPPANEAIAQKRARLATLMDAYRQEENTPSREERLGAVWARAHPPAIIPLLQNKKNTFSLAPIPNQGLEREWVMQGLTQAASRATRTPGVALPAEFSPEKYAIVAGYSAGIRSNGMGISAGGSFFHQTSVSYGSKVLPIPGYDAAQSEDLWRGMQQVSGFGLHFGRPRVYSETDNEEAAFKDKTIPALFTLLGPDAVDWWNKEQADTLACLKNLTNDTPPPAPAPPKETPLRLYDRLRSPQRARQVPLSDALEGWTARTQTEAIMELHPRVELWETWDSYPAPEASVKAGAAFLPLSTWIHTSELHSGGQAVADQWSVREKNKVLLVTSRMEWVERPQNMPLPELIELQSDLQKWYAHHSGVPVPVSPRTNSYLPYEPLAIYARAALSRREGRTWSAVDTLADYHSAYLPGLDGKVLALFLWSKLGKKEQMRLLTPPPGKAGDFTVSVPMSRFGQSTLDTLMELLREQGQIFSDSLLPYYQNQITNSRFEINVAADDDPANALPGCRAIRLGFRQGANWMSGRSPNISASILMPIPSGER